MSPVDLTKCQPGDRLIMRCSDEGIYLGCYWRRDPWPHLIRCDRHGEYGVDASGRCYNDGDESSGDIVAIVHPTRAEIEEQRRELLVALKELRSFYIASTGLTPHAANAAIARVEAPHE